MRPRYVLVGVDERSDAIGAARFAVSEAAERRLDLMLAFGYTALVERPAAPGGPALDRRHRAQTVLREVAQHLVLPAAMEIELVAEDVPPLTLLARLAPEAERIVLGRHHLGMRERVPDPSLASRLAEEVGCPVVIVPPGSRPGQRPSTVRAPVVVALDGETDAASALRVAFDEAERHGLMVLALHAEPLTSLTSQAEDDTRDLAEILAGWKADHPDIAVRTLVCPAEPSDLIVQASRDAALLVVGRPHEPRLGAWSRSVAGEVLKLARCPLVLAPPAYSASEGTRTGGTRTGDTRTGGTRTG